SSNRTGAKGRNQARSFTLELSLSFMLASRGSAKMERFPNARGPTSERPLGARPSKRLMIVPQGTPKRGTGVRRKRQYPDGAIIRVAKNASIGDAVKRDTASQT